MAGQELEIFEIKTEELKDPNEVLAQAQKRAKALQSVVDQKKDPVIFNKQRYLEFDDWQTLGNFYGLVVTTQDPEYIKIGEVEGAKAKAIVMSVRTGQIVGGATGWCMRDEPNWNTRPKYEYQYVWKSTGKPQAGECPKEELIWEKTKEGKSYPKKERIYLGEEIVPWFQLGSMAQTRAGAKALRNLLSWVAVLAGYKPTPAEEMTGTEHPPEPETNANQPSQPQSKQDPNANITDKQVKRLYAIGHSKPVIVDGKQVFENGKPKWVKRPDGERWTKEQIDIYLQTRHIVGAENIRAVIYEEICQFVMDNPPSVE